jgi:hypothetical protein
MPENIAIWIIRKGINIRKRLIREELQRGVKNISIGFASNRQKCKMQG